MPEEAPAATPATPAAAAPTATPEPAAPTAPVESVDALPSWAQKIITDARKEAGDFRVAAKTAAEKASQEVTDKLAVALGLKADPTVDPAALTAKIAEAQQTAKQSAIQLAVYKAAGASKANPDALLDSNTFLASVSQLDPTAADFASQVASAVQTAVTANPTLKAVQAAAASGIDISGGSGEQGQLTEAQYDAIKHNPDALIAAQNKGLLRDILGG